MLRVEIEDSPDTLLLKLAGRLTRDEAEHTRTLVTHCLHRTRLVVDLTEVTFIDSVGEEVLSFFGRFGAEFVAETSYTLDACQRLHLRLPRGRGLDGEKGRTIRRAHTRQPENKDI